MTTKKTSKKKTAKKAAKNADPGAVLFLKRNVYLNEKRVARTAQKVSLADLLDSVERAFEDLTAE